MTVVYILGYILAGIATVGYPLGITWVAYYLVGGDASSYKDIHPVVAVLLGIGSLAWIVAILGILGRGTVSLTDKFTLRKRSD